MEIPDELWKEAIAARQKETPEERRQAIARTKSHMELARMSEERATQHIHFDISSEEL